MGGGTSGAAPPAPIPTVFTIQNDTLAASETTTSTSYVATSLALTLANRATAFALVTVSATLDSNTAAAQSSMVIFDDGATVNNDMSNTVPTANYTNFAGQSLLMALNGSALVVRFKTSAAATARIYGTAGTAQSNMTILEVGP